LTIDQRLDEAERAEQSDPVWSRLPVLDFQLNVILRKAGMEAIPNAGNIDVVLCNLIIKKKKGIRRFFLKLCSRLTTKLRFSQLPIQ
jgi:hypothetical protein